MMTRMPVTIPSAPKIIFPEKNAHALKPNDRVVNSVTKIRWNALSDILVRRAGWKILQCVKRQAHQSGEKENGEREQRVDHFFLGNQVHEKSGNDKGVGARNGEDERDFQRPGVMFRQKRNP